MRLTKKQIKIIREIDLSYILIEGLIVPVLDKILKPKNPQEKYHNNRIFTNLVKNGLVHLSGDKVVLSKQGQMILDRLNLEELTVSVQNKWNGKWHLVCYDIPETKKLERDFLRSKLFGFGFIKIQNSLWAFPYECREQIAIIASGLGISPYVAYLYTDHLPNQDFLKFHFKLDNK